MKWKIIYTHTARQDLRDIHDYIAHTLLEPGTAKDISEAILREARSLEEMPERNPLYPEEPWHSRGVRTALVKNYLIFYRIKHDGQSVSIARVLYAGRDISRQLEETEGL